MQKNFKVNRDRVPPASEITQESFIVLAATAAAAMNHLSLIVTSFLMSNTLLMPKPYHLKWRSLKLVLVVLWILMSNIELLV